MKIGFILCEHPLDVRIKKEARSLASAGHEAVALLQERDMNQPVIAADSITVDTYAPPSESELHRALVFIKRMSFMKIPLEDRIEEFARKHKVDALHVHDLPNVGPGIRVARKLGIPIVADLHENHPAAVRAWVGPIKPQHYITTNQTIWNSYQKRCVMGADRVIVVIEEGRDLLVAHGIPEDKIHVVANYVDLDYLAKCSETAQSWPEYDGKFVISYTGFLGPDRGVDMAIRAMAMLKKDAPKAHLVVVGDAPAGSSYINVLHNLVKKLDVLDSVELAGWQPFSKIPGYVASCSIGLVPHQRNPHRDNTIPNKLFDYMGFNKPVVVSDCPPLKRIVTAANAGLVFPASSPEKLAECILKLYNNADMVKQLGANAAQSVQTNYNWTNAGAELVRVYEKIARRNEIGVGC